ncbi:hypothetical protein KAK05_02635, partial [Candidatus Parcubacteria bacterium]|nr:hypothetical protein [Candidatus Parcubacteria bacterium]
MEPAEELSFFEKTKNIFSVPEAKAEEVQVGDAEPTIEAESTSEDVELMVGQEDFTEPIEEDSGIVKGDAESLELIEEVKENDQGEEEIEENNEEKFEDYSGTVIIPDVDGNLLFEIEENKEEEEVQAIFTEEFNAIYSDFSVFQESGELKKIKIGFSFASSGKQNEDDEIIVSWSLNDQNWNIASEFVLDKEYSNKANGGYFYVDIFDLSNLNGNKILEWEDVENIKIKFSYLTNNSKENYVPFFLDAVWLETESEEESGAELEEDDEEIIKKEKIEILSHKKDFKINEELEFKFKYKKEKENLLVSIGETLGIVDYWDGVNLSAEIISSNREVFRISSEESSNFSEIFTLDKDGEISIK